MSLPQYNQPIWQPDADRARLDRPTLTGAAKVLGVWAVYAAIAVVLDKIGGSPSGKWAFDVHAHTATTRRVDVDVLKAIWVAVGAVGCYLVFHFSIIWFGWARVFAWRPPVPVLPGPDDFICEGWETLWYICTVTGRNPREWYKLFDENKGRRQPDGRIMRDPYPLGRGWFINVGASAGIAAITPPPAPKPPTAPKPTGGGPAGPGGPGRGPGGLPTGSDSAGAGDLAQVLPFPGLAGGSTTGESEGAERSVAAVASQSEEEEVTGLAPGSQAEEIAESVQPEPPAAPAETTVAAVVEIVPDVPVDVGPTPPGVIAQEPTAADTAPSLPVAEPRQVPPVEAQSVATPVAVEPPPVATEPVTEVPIETAVEAQAIGEPAAVVRTPTVEAAPLSLLDQEFDLFPTSGERSIPTAGAGLDDDETADWFENYVIYNIPPELEPDGETALWAEAALRLAAHECRQAGRAFPTVIGARVNTAAVEVHFAEGTAGEPTASFASAGGDLWVLVRDMASYDAASNPEIYDGDRPVPSFVPIGTDPSGWVFVALAEWGDLSLDVAEPDDVGGLISAYLGFHSPETLVIASGGTRWASANCTSSLGETLPTLSFPRTDNSGPMAAAVVLLPQLPGKDELEGMRRYVSINAEHLPTDITLVAYGPFPSAHWHLDSSGDLPEIGVTLSCVGTRNEVTAPRRRHLAAVPAVGSDSAEDTTVGTTSSLRDATGEAGESSPGESGSVDDEVDIPAVSSLAGAYEDEPFEIGLLGTIDFGLLPITNKQALAKTGALVAFLAHKGGVSNSTEWAPAIFGAEEVPKSTRATVAARAVAALGTSATGQPRLVRMHRKLCTESLTTDVRRMSALARAGHGYEAMKIIRGVPCTGGERMGWEGVANTRREIQAEVRSVADMVVRTALTDRDAALALEMARMALHAIPTDQVLWELALRAGATLGEPTLRKVADEMVAAFDVGLPDVLGARLNSLLRPLEATKELATAGGASTA